MKSFSPGFIERQPVSQSLLRTIRLLGEYKGRQAMPSGGNVVITRE
ncbi:MAG: hypothetical protein ACYDDH_03860 [Candidatus Desulforudaceae bacterium]